MLYEKQLRSKKATLGIVSQIKALNIARRVKIMEVCGTHTYSFFRFGLRSLLDEYVDLIAGPGCPVCITESSFIDRALYLAQNEKTIIATFGDLIRVKGTIQSLEEARAEGAHIEIVYSPLDALTLAKQHKKKRVTFLSVGFETTAPLVAACLRQAKKERIENFFILCNNRLIPPALEALCNDADLVVEGFLCPGHVSAIIGANAYRGIVAQHKKGCVVSGFEPIDMTLSLYKLLAQVKHNAPKLENTYTRLVKDEGNVQAQKMLYEVFGIEDASWRGLGVIPKSGLTLRPAFKHFDAEQFIKARFHEASLPSSCRCADVIKGKIKPPECAQFRKGCTALKPLGPCMVSFEGSCRIYYEMSS